jgi:hypothetical protein
VIAEQRHRAALARPPHDPLRVRAAPDHVSERPELLRARALRRAEDRVERLGVGVGVAEDRDEHS